MLCVSRSLTEKTGTRFSFATISPRVARRFSGGAVDWSTSIFFFASAEVLGARSAMEVRELVCVVPRHP